MNGNKNIIKPTPALRPSLKALSVFLFFMIFINLFFAINQLNPKNAKAYNAANYNKLPTGSLSNTDWNELKNNYITGDIDRVAGISTVAEGQKLRADGGANSGELQLKTNVNGGNYWALYSHMTFGDFNIWNGSNLLTIKAAGNVGIGNSTPAHKLDVTGNINGTQLCIANVCRNAWPVGGTGTVTNVATDASLTGGPITTTGTLSVNTATIQSRVTTTCPAGQYMSAIAQNGTATCVGVNNATFQSRVTGTCPAGQYIRIIDVNGNVTCGVDAGGGTGTVTNVATGVGLTGGPITTTGTLSVNTATIQSRVSGTCPAGQYIRIIDVNGNVTCGVDAAGGALAGGVANNLTKWTAATTVGNSIIVDNGTSIGIGVAPGGDKLAVVGTNKGIYGAGSDYGLWGAGGTTGVYGVGTTNGVFGSGPTGVYGTSAAGSGVSGISSAGGSGGYFSSVSGPAIVTGSGNVGIGTGAPTSKLHVVGNIYSTGQGAFATLAANGSPVLGSTMQTVYSAWVTTGVSNFYNAVATCPANHRATGCGYNAGSNACVNPGSCVFIQTATGGNTCTASIWATGGIGYPFQAVATCAPMTM